MFGLIRRFRRQRLAKRPLPAQWAPLVEAGLPFYQNLDHKERERFWTFMKIFLWEKKFFGANGLTVTEEMKVVIAGAAVRLVLYLDISYYNRLTEIVIYPSAYQADDPDEIRLGEAHHFGTVVLSWQAVLDGIRRPCDGHDTALHEFAHVLDRGGGGFDGTPRLRASEHYRAWANVMSRHFVALQKGSRRQAQVLRMYGAKNEAEFFSVATESFFERPVDMQRLLPDLYQTMRLFYGFDPASDGTCGVGLPRM